MNPQTQRTATDTPFSSQGYFWIIPALLVIGGIYILSHVTSEPFYNNDETRHVMTGVYFRDLLHDLPFRDLKAYTIDYYLQYPALGLLVWPPFFYFVEGVTMSLFGTSIIVSDTLIWMFAALGFTYLFLLVREVADTHTAIVATFIFSLCPLVFELSHHVMLETPTMALSLAVIFHFNRYLDLDRRRDLVLAALGASLAALTRFDAGYLFPVFLILVLAKRRGGILLRKEVLVTAGIALILVLPFYLMSAFSIGWVHVKSVTDTSSSNVPALFSLKRFFFYPSLLRPQMGWFALIPALVGVASSLLGREKIRCWVFLGMIIATYVTFTPIGEIESRHTVYWLPAFAFFAAHGIHRIATMMRTPAFYFPLAAVVLAGTGWTALSKPQTYLRGYEEAATYVEANEHTSRYCFFVGRLDGDFVYQLRTHDQARKLWVLRADKLLVSVINVPGGDYRPLATGEEDTLNTIFKYDPEFLVVEQPRALDQSSEEEKVHSEFDENVRKIIRNHPERFKLEKEIATDCNDSVFSGITLEIFRNTFRNQNPDRNLEMEIPMLKRSLQTSRP